MAVIKHHNLETSNQTVQQQQQQLTKRWNGSEDVSFTAAREAVLAVRELAVHVAENKITERWDIKFWVAMNSNRQNANSFTKCLNPKQLVACPRPDILEIKSTLDKAKYLATQAKVAHDLEHAHL